MVNPFKEVNWKPGLADLRKFARSLVIGFPCVAVVLLLAGRLHSQTGAWNFRPPLLVGGIGVAFVRLFLACPPSPNRFTSCGISWPVASVWSSEMSCFPSLFMFLLRVDRKSTRLNSSHV